LKKKFEATSNRANSLSRSLNSPNNKFPNKGGYVLETSKLFGGATVFKFSGVSKSSDGVEKNSSDESTSGSNVQSKVMFYIKFQEERKDETFSPKTGSATAQDNTGQRFPSVAELRALFGTAGVPNLQKLSKKKNRQADNSNTNNNNNMEESDLDSKKNNEENEEEGDVMLEQALCRRILGKEVRRALKSLLAQQRMDALKCHPTEKDIEGREVKPLIDDFQQRKMDDSEHVGVFTNRMRKGRISVPPETTENAENSCSDQVSCIHLFEFLSFIFMNISRQLPRWKSRMQHNPKFWMWIRKKTSLLKTLMSWKKRRTMMTAVNVMKRTLVMAHMKL